SIASTFGSTITSFFVSTADGNSNVWEMRTYGSGQVPALVGSMARGTAASPTATQSGDVMLEFGATGYDGSSFATNTGALVKLLAGSNWTGSSHETVIDVNLVASGSVAAPVNVLRIGQGMSLPSSVTGGAKGAGTFNVSTGYYINGNAIPWTA